MQVETKTQDNILIVNFSDILTTVELDELRQKAAQFSLERELSTEELEIIRSYAYRLNREDGQIFVHTNRYGTIYERYGNESGNYAWLTRPVEDQVNPQYPVTTIRFYCLSPNEIKINKILAEFRE